LAYNLVGFVLWGMSQGGLPALSSYRPWDEGPSLGELINLANCGNLLVVVVRVQSAVASSQVYSMLWDTTSQYALFPGILAAVCLTLAVWRLRAVALRQAFNTPHARRGRLVRRPPMGDRPIVWREAYLERGRLAWVITALLYLAFGAGAVAACAHP